MAIVSYRIYCEREDCSNKEVIREKKMDDHPWKISSKINHSGVCPACNEAINLDDDNEYSRHHEDVEFEKLDSIGDSGAANLREKGIVTRQDVKDASDEEILDNYWVEEKGLKSIRQEVQ